MRSSHLTGLDGAVARHLDDLTGACGDGSPGFAVAVHAHGETACAAAGSANLEHAVPIAPSTVFHVASLSKQVTARCVALLAEAGALSPDDDARRYVPELPDFGGTIRIGDLVHHTSGLRDDLWLQDFAGWTDDAWISEADTLDLISRQRALSAPTGSRFLYSNAGYSLLALIVARVGGLPFAEFARQRLFEPLGMPASRFARVRGEIVPNRAAAYEASADGGFRTVAPDVGQPGAIGLLTTVEDFARWMAHLHDEIAGDTPFARLVATPGRLAGGEPVPYAWGFFTEPHRGQRTIRHGGSHGGYRAHVLILPDRGYGVACFANHGEANPGRICETLIDALLGAEDAPSAPSNRVAAWPLVGADPRPGLYHDADRETWLHLRRDGSDLLLDDVRPRVLARRGDGRHEAAPGGVPVRLAAAPVGEGEALCLLVWTGSSEEPDRYVPAADPPPDPADLAAYAGTYWSDELGVAYRIGIAPDGERLLLTRRGHDPASLLPTACDEFCVGFLINQVTLAFVRDENGAATGFALSSLRTRNVRFVRSPFGDAVAPAPGR